MSAIRSRKNVLWKLALNEESTIRFWDKEDRVNDGTWEYQPGQELKDF